jgi:hypothetical protein
MISLYMRSRLQVFSHLTSSCCVHLSDILEHLCPEHINELPGRAQEGVVQHQHGKWLSFEDNNRIQYAFDKDGNKLYPHENYARGERIPGAKKIINGDSGGISSSGEISKSLCANSCTIYTAGSCFTARSTIARHFCNYAEKRLNLTSAMEKCMAHGCNQYH